MKWFICGAWCLLAGDWKESRCREAIGESNNRVRARDRAGWQAAEGVSA